MGKCGEWFYEVRIKPSEGEPHLTTVALLSSPHLLISSSPSGFYLLSLSLFLILLLAVDRHARITIMVLFYEYYKFVIPRYLRG